MLAELADGRELTSTELRKEIAVARGPIVYGDGKSWGGNVPIGPRVLTILSARGAGRPRHERRRLGRSRPRWASMQAWLGEELDAPPERGGVGGLVEGWLRAFGPGSETDIKWWLGSTLKAVRTALADLEAAEVDLDGRAGYVLPGDLEDSGPLDPWPALLPGLTRRRWAGPSASGTSVPTSSSSSTQAATPARLPGGKGGSSVAGASGTTARWCCSCSRMSAGPAATRSRQRRRG